MTGAKVPNSELVDAGLLLMERAGKPLQRIEARGRAMIYRAPDGQTVRVRTCNDHVLVTLAESAAPQAPLNIEGTNQLLIVMPQTPRSRGHVFAYLVPTEVAVEAVRRTHQEWVASNPQTNGKNRIWNIWFDDSGHSKANDFARKWLEYRLPDSIDVSKPVQRQSAPIANLGTSILGQVIADAKRQIASVAGVPESAIRISVDLT